MPRPARGNDADEYPCSAGRVYRYTANKHISYLELSSGNVASSGSFVRLTLDLLSMTTPVFLMHAVSELNGLPIWGKLLQ